MCIDSLSACELALMRLFFDIYPSWTTAILGQLDGAQLYRHNCISSCFINFIVDRDAEKMDVNVRVPVEIILGLVEVPPEHIIGTIKGAPIVEPCMLKINDDNAIGLRLHFKDGYINELEMYSLNGGKIEMEERLFSQVTYIVRHGSVQNY